MVLLNHSGDIFGAFLKFAPGVQAPGSLPTARLCLYRFKFFMVYSRFVRKERLHICPFFGNKVWLGFYCFSGNNISDVWDSFRFVWIAQAFDGITSVHDGITLELFLPGYGDFIKPTKHLRKRIRYTHRREKIVNL